MVFVKGTGWLGAIKDVDLVALFLLDLGVTGRRLATPQRALGCRRSDTARQRLQRGSRRQAGVRRRVSYGKAAATAGAGDFEPAKVADASSVIT